MLSTDTSALTDATKLAWNAWEQVARQLDNGAVSWELSAREAATWEIALRLTYRIMLLTAWQEAQRPMDIETRSWN